MTHPTPRATPPPPRVGCAYVGPDLLLLFPYSLARPAGATFWSPSRAVQDNGPFYTPAADSEIRTLEQMREFEIAAYNLTQRGVEPGGHREVSGNGFDYDVHDPGARGHDDWALAALNGMTMLHETTIPFVRGKLGHP